MSNKPRDYKVLISDRTLLIDSGAEGVNVIIPEKELKGHVFSVKWLKGDGPLTIKGEKGSIEGLLEIQFSALNQVMTVVSDGADSHLLNRQVP